MPWVTIGGYAAAAVLLWLWLETRDDLAAEVERCNVDKIQSILDAEILLREADREAAEATAAELARQLTLEQKARQIADTAAREAESRPVRVRTVIREVASENLCLDTAVPAAVLNELR